MSTEGWTLRRVARYLGVDAVWWVNAGQPVYLGITRHELWGQVGDKRGRLCAFDLAANDSANAIIALCKSTKSGVSDLEILKTNRRSW